MAKSINDTILAILRDNPQLSNEEVADEVQRRIPGATTSAASVSSVKSKAKKNGQFEGASSGVVRPLYEAEQIELPEETEEERSDRIRRRYATLTRMAYRVAEGGLPALVVSGPPGLGKSFTVEEVLEEVRGEAEAPHDADIDEEDDDNAGMSTAWQPYDIISGTITAVGLYIALWNQREGGVVVLDDCDDVFRDETCLNLLKAVLDSSPIRRVSYRKKAHWMEEMGIPSSFTFSGSVVFCTNIDFEMAIARGSNMGAHYGALMDRSLYLSLTMRTKADYITRLRHVSIEDKMLEKMGLSAEQAEEAMAFVIDNVDRFYGLSLRLMHQIAICMKADPVNWKDDIEATKMRTI